LLQPVGIWRHNAGCVTIALIGTREDEVFLAGQADVVALSTKPNEIRPVKSLSKSQNA
jgi:hypothetical protein